MGTATIVLEDVDGAIAAKTTFTGGFDAQSHAHQHAQILMGLMDQLCENKGPIAEKVIEPVKPLVLLNG